MLFPRMRPVKSKIECRHEKLSKSCLLRSLTFYRTTRTSLQPFLTQNQNFFTTLRRCFCASRRLVYFLFSSAWYVIAGANKVIWSLRCVGTNVSAAQFRIKSFQISSMGIFCRETVSPRMTVSFASRTACENVWWWRWRSWSTVWRKKVCRRRQRRPSK